MALSETVRRMLATLPAYYDSESIVERIMQARANEVDRFDTLIDAISTQVQPGQATDELGLLGMWEFVLGLPIRPPDATVAQRQSKADAALRRLDAGSSEQAMEVLEAAIGGSFVVLRDTPDPLRDTLEIPYDAGSYNAAQVEAIAQRIWPAHRELLMRYSEGFILDVARLDAETL